MLSSVDLTGSDVMSMQQVFGFAGGNIMYCIVTAHYSDSKSDSEYQNLILSIRI